MMRSVALLFIIFLLVASCSSDEPTPEIQLTEARVGSYVLDLNSVSQNVPVNQPLQLTFSAPLKSSTVIPAFQIQEQNGTPVEGILTLINEERTINFQPFSVLKSYTRYTITLKNSLRGSKDERFEEKSIVFITEPGELQVTSLKINGSEVFNLAPVKDVSLTPVIEIRFNEKLNPAELQPYWFRILGPQGNTPVSLAASPDSLAVTINPINPLTHFSRYQVWVSPDLTGKRGEPFSGFNKYFYTVLDETPKFPLLSDDDLLTLVQHQTFKYFYDFAHPASGMARERNNSGDLVTTGGSGFGIMALIVGVERGFITREQCLTRMDKILDFLETADRFHGVWPHWINGNTGRVIPFSANDNGGDLVETAFLVQGLLTMRQYLNPANPAEQDLINRINSLWYGVEWNWYRRGGQNVLYWHWSADKGWVMNMQVRGWNEALIVYVLAASSPTYPIPKVVYDNGWALNGGIINGNSYEGITLPLGYAYGGPLFFAHYSFLGLNPTGLSDTYCSDYFLQNRNHSLINYRYCVRNPKSFIGYSEKSWGLTASDNHNGYNAHSPTNDLGVITPTAALSSFPYTPEESMRALKFFYYTIGDKLWGPYGFYDAFNPTMGWTANSYLAIDQGPIVVMIENYRTGLLWNLFMSAPEVQTGLTNLGFNY
ncbi:MAG: Ig-like domain-containing protein [Cyclobacteriaceae bacterium]|nr:Ig-like domain-containing protein [Cyclobacteriaceae bacterium]